jgi:kynurenine formamidase
VEVRPGDIVLIRYWPGTWGEPMEEFLAVRGITLDACEWLAARGVKAVGVDHPNLEGQVKGEYGNLNAPGHEMFLHPDHYVPIIENLVDLGTSGSPRFWFAALPLKIAEGTGSPVRAVAVVPQ